METTGYYGGYVNTLVALSGVADQQSAIAARDQVMQQRQQQSQLDATTRNTLLTMFNRQMQNQTKLDYYDANDAVANQYRSAGQAIMGSDPQTGLNLLKEADQFGLQNTQQRLAASRVAQDTSNRLAAFAGLVDDQTGLDDYKALLAQTGQQLPEQYSTMNDATKAYLRRTAALALPADKMLTLQQRNLEYQMRLQRSAEKTAHEKVLEAQRDRENAARRENQDQREVSGNVNLTAPKSETALLGEERALEVFDETGVFKNLPDPAKRTATIAVFSRARDLAQANPNADRKSVV